MLLLRFWILLARTFSEGRTGALYAVIALGTQFMAMNQQELAAFKAEVEGEKKLWFEVGTLKGSNKFQVLELVTDEGKTVVCVKTTKGEGSSAAAWRDSSFLGRKADPDGTLPVVYIDNVGEHAFAEAGRILF